MESEIINYEKGTTRKFTDKIVHIRENVTKYNGKITLFLK